MKYPRIAAAVPQGEHFDEAAINEGVYFSVAHVQNIETALEQNSTAISGHPAALAALQANVDSLTLKVQESAAAEKTANDNLVAANTTIANHEATIETLNARVSELEDEAPLKTTSKKKDDLGKNKGASWKDPKSSINSIADRYFSANRTAAKVEEEE